MLNINSLPNIQTTSLYQNSTSTSSRVDFQEDTIQSNNSNENVFDILDRMSEEMEKDLDRQEFDNFIKEVRGEFDDKDIDNLVKYQNEGTALEEAGDMEGAQQVWDKFDAILEKYDALGGDEEKDYAELSISENKISQSSADTLSKQIENLKDLFGEDDTLKELLSLSKNDISKMSYGDMFEKLDNIFSLVENKMAQNQPLGNRLDLTG